jgi:hypothetical protein
MALLVHRVLHIQVGALVVLEMLLRILHRRLQLARLVVLALLLSVPQMWRLQQLGRQQL